MRTSNATIPSKSRHFRALEATILCKLRRCRVSEATIYRKIRFVRVSNVSIFRKLRPFRASEATISRKLRYMRTSNATIPSKSRRSRALVATIPRKLRHFSAFSRPRRFVIYATFGVFEATRLRKLRHSRKSEATLWRRRSFVNYAAAAPPRQRSLCISNATIFCNERAGTESPSDRARERRARASRTKWLS